MIQYIHGLLKERKLQDGCNRTTSRKVLYFAGCYTAYPLVNRLKGLLLFQPGKSRCVATEGSQSLYIVAECTGFEMLVSHRFPFKTLDMHKVALVVVVSITLTTHSTGAMFGKGIEILVDYFLRRLVPAFRYREGHYIP